MALQDLTMMLPSRLGYPLSLKTPNMGNPGLHVLVISLYLNNGVTSLYVALRLFLKS